MANISVTKENSKEDAGSSEIGCKVTQRAAKKNTRKDGGSGLANKETTLTATTHPPTREAAATMGSAKGADGEEVGQKTATGKSAKYRG